MSRLDVFVLGAVFGAVVVWTVQGVKELFAAPRGVTNV